MNPHFIYPPCNPNETKAEDNKWIDLDVMNMQNLFKVMEPDFRKKDPYRNGLLEKADFILE